ncbi:hypothetical protein [Reichenbachiella versicolor]|uniref:hypothetical protein n=1 Tax=Reichenbachiella versicolor TaxID=1821036 RepID=UPI000D6DE54D|nr:hypothetical protein [Reichenbachiella versicolor]
MNKVIFFLFFTYLIVTTAHAQWILQKEIHLQEVDRSDIDTKGNIYISKYNGEVLKYSLTGEIQLQYSPVKNGRIHNIDASSQLKVLLFYEGLQEYVILDRYLAKPVVYPFRDYDLGFVTNVSINRQNELWVVDLNEFALTLVDVRRNEVLENKSLAQVLDRENADILNFRFHQGNMYLNDRFQGLLVFDNIGNFIKQIELSYGTLQGFYRDYLYLSNGKRLILRHLYDDSQSEIVLPHEQYSKILYAGNNLVLITEQGFEIYKYLSGE